MAEDGHVQIFASPDILQEIHRVLGYKKILRILKRSGKEPTSIMATIVSLCSLVDVNSVVQAIDEDSTDNQLLACAKEATADFLISGDRHLLQLEEYEHTKILTPSSFLDKRQYQNAK